MVAVTERTPIIQEESQVSAAAVQAGVDEVWKPAPLVPSTIWHGCFMISSPEIPWPSRRIILGVALLSLTNAMGIFAAVYTQNAYHGDCDDFPNAVPQSGRTSVSYAFELCGYEGNLMLAALNQLTFVGAGLGVLVGGYLADAIGRYWSCVIFSALNVLAIAGSAIAPSYNVYALCRLLVGAGSIGVAVPSFAIVTEWIPWSWKVPIGVSLFNGTSYVLGEIVDMALALCFVEWREFTAAVMIGVAVLTVLALMLIKESPQWLATQHGREKEVFALMGLDINFRTTPPFDAQERAEPKDAKHAIPDAELVYSRLATWAMAFCWFTAAMSYFGISLAVAGLKGSIYVSATLSGLSEIPASILAVYLLRSPAIGRSSGHAMLFTGAAVACLIMPAVVDNQLCSLMCMMVGKACCTACFCGLYCYTSELYVAACRGSGMALCSAMGRVGCLVAPLLTAELPIGLAYATFGVFATSAAFICRYVLPETGGVQTEPKK